MALENLVVRILQVRIEIGIQYWKVEEKSSFVLLINLTIGAFLVIVLQIPELLISENSFVRIIIAFFLFSLSSLLVDSHDLRVSKACESCILGVAAVKMVISALEESNLPVLLFQLSFASLSYVL